MITKAELLKHAITKFTQCGSKHVTLDELASALGISKKTIYSFFKNKEDLVTASLDSLLKEFREDIDGIVNSNGKDPVFCVILIYRRGFEYLKYFKPSFLFGLEKYYPKASQLFDSFIEDLSNTIVFKLLTQAKVEGSIKAEVNIELVVKIYFFRVDNLLFKSTNLFELYTEEDLFKHLVIYNLKGIVSSDYTNRYME
ncbi:MULTISPECIES: TetR/AcrR family transcriptional regulator [unclassified Olleya]|uniref:TetR/AcrR family transcriptional regulator n=1 Tax=unclassified Olleya TaxID=2615019 RepID=UPI000C31B414|nr:MULTISPECIES: TetR/AcrR family transcriptional regulator [unclassified Olleya]AUC74528.1 TetR/AcrR family transcriptional regulator [Olleya sp. Bg11-27]QXP60454.1 TetR/AcrR family transcriptional regulator [Olleya sp. HaHaR_3_96]